MNGKLQVDFAVGKADNPKVNGILLVQGGKQNTHFEAHKKYLKALDEIKQQQVQQHEEKEVLDYQKISTFDYFSDDEDLSTPKSPINASLSQPWLLEFFSLGCLALFFGINNVLLTDPQGKRNL